MAMPGKTTLKLASLAALGAAALLTPVAASARLFDFHPLDAPMVERLPAESKAAYMDAIDAIDHINYLVGFERINDAVKMAPDNTELRFLAVRLGRYMGETSSGIDSARYFDNAIEHANAIMANPSLTLRDRGRAEYILNWLNQQRKIIEQRDEARRSYGLQIAKSYAKSVYSGDQNSAEIKKFKDAIAALTQPGSTSQRATAAAAAALSKAVGQVRGAAAGVVAPAGTEGAAAAPAGSTVEVAGLNGAPGAMAQPDASLPAPKALGHSTMVKKGIEGPRTPLGADDDRTKAAEAFIRSVLDDTLKTWNVDKLMTQVDPEMLAGVNLPGDKTQMAKTIFSTIGGYTGGVKQIKGLSGETSQVSTASGTVTSAEYVASVEFEKGEIDVFIEAVKRGPAEWMVRDLNLDPEKLNEMSGGALGALLGGGIGKGAKGGNGGGMPSPFGGSAKSAPAAAPAASAPAEPAPAAEPAAPAPAGGAAPNPFGN